VQPIAQLLVIFLLTPARQSTKTRALLFPRDLGATMRSERERLDR